MAFRIDILTLFPEMFNVFNHSIIEKAIEKNIIDINTINIREFTEDKHKRGMIIPMVKVRSRNGDDSTAYSGLP